jgi:cell division protein FtsN
MEEATSWKGHTFTLFVFAGIVVLCSIFFILGMLVARAQAQKLAPADANASILKGEAKRGVPEDKSEFTFYDAVKKEPPAEFDREPAKLETPVAPPPAAVTPPKPLAASPQASPNKLHYQVGAVRKRVDAAFRLDLFPIPKRRLRKKNWKLLAIGPYPRSDG